MKGSVTREGFCPSLKYHPPLIFKERATEG